MDRHTPVFGLLFKPNSSFCRMSVLIYSLAGCVCVCHVLQRHSKSRLTCQSVEKEDDAQERSGREAGGQFNR